MSLTYCRENIWMYILLQYISSSISSHFQEPIKFKIKDKEHTLGSVSVPVPGLPTSPNKQWLPLQPHKRASEAHGSLQVGCWVSSSGSGEKVSDQIPSTSSHGTFDRSTLPRLHSNRHSMYDSTSSAGEKETGMRSYQSDDNVRERGVKEKVMWTLCVCLHPAPCSMYYRRKSKCQR